MSRRTRLKNFPKDQWEDDGHLCFQAHSKARVITKGDGVLLSSLGYETKHHTSHLAQGVHNSFSAPLDFHIAVINPICKSTILTQRIYLPKGGISVIGRLTVCHLPVGENYGFIYLVQARFFGILGSNTPVTLAEESQSSKCLTFWCETKERA